MTYTTPTAAGIWGSSTPAGQSSYVLLRTLPGSTGGLPHRELLDFMKVEVIDTFVDRFEAHYLLVTEQVAYALKLTQEAIGNPIVEFTHAIGPCHPDGSRDIALADEPEPRTIRSTDYSPTTTAYWLRSETTGQHFVVERQTTTEARRAIH